MKIDIDHIAKLSKLKIEDDKRADFQKKIEDVIEMVEQLPALDGSSSILDSENPMELRADTPKAEEEKISRDELLQNAPQAQAGCFVVPKIVE